MSLDGGLSGHRRAALSWRCERLEQLARDEVARRERIRNNAQIVLGAVPILVALAAARTAGSTTSPLLVVIRASMMILCALTLICAWRILGARAVPYIDLRAVPDVVGVPVIRRTWPNDLQDYSRHLLAVVDAQRRAHEITAGHLRAAQGYGLATMFAILLTILLQEIP